MVEGLFKFHETFRLVYLLRSSEDIIRETGLVLPALEVSQLEPQRGSDGDLW